LLPAPLRWEWNNEWGAFSAPGALEALLAQIGLTVIGDGTVACPCDYPDLETAWQAQVSAGPLQAVQRITGAAYLKALVQDALSPYRAGTGGIHLVNHFRYVTAVPNHDVASARGAIEQRKGATAM